MQYRLKYGFPASLAALAFALPARADFQPGQGYERGMEDGMGYGYGWFSGWFMGPVMMILFLVAVVAGIVLVVRLVTNGTANGPASQSNTDSALAALEMRFARGEIDEEEFRRRKETLQG